MHETAHQVPSVKPEVGQPERVPAGVAAWTWYHVWIPDGLHFGDGTVRCSGDDSRAPRAAPGHAQASGVFLRERARALGVQKRVSHAPNLRVG